MRFGGGENTPYLLHFSCFEMLHSIFRRLIFMIKYDHVIARSLFPDMNFFFPDEV